MRLLWIILLAAIAIESKGKDMEISDEMIDAMIQVESQGNDRAIGDNGKALGCLQIHKIMVDDVNRIAGTKFVHKDAFIRTRAKEMIRIAVKHYVTPERLGREPTFEDCCRFWNSGPSWITKKKATDGYWAKVQAVMKKGATA